MESFLLKIVLIKDLSHPNVLGLLGVVFDTPGGIPHLVLPFMENGNLKKLLVAKRKKTLNVDKFPEVSSAVLFDIENVIVAIYVVFSRA